VLAVLLAAACSHPSAASHPATTTAPPPTTAEPPVEEARSILVLGDSISEGATLDRIDQRWPALVQDALRHGERGGFGFWPSFYGPGNHRPARFAGDVEPVETAGPSRAAVAIGPRGRVTFPHVVGTSIRVWFDSGRLAVEVDDRPPVVVDGRTWQDVTTGGEPGSTHTVVVRGQGDHPAVLGGIEVFDGDEGRGAHVFVAARSGLTSGHFASADPGEWVQGTEADVVVIGLGVNDWERGVPVEGYRRNLGTIVDAVRRGRPRLPVVLVAWPEPAARFSGPHPWREYVAAMRAVARPARGVELLDLSDERLPTSDGLHPDAAGHRRIARRVLALLGAT
jgi:lysophospholipase L1-like esterase